MAYDDMKGGWKWLTGDSDWETYGGSWAKRCKRTGGWYVIVMMNWEEATGETDLPQYNASVRYVDYPALTPAMIKSALDCCGVDLDHYKDEAREMVIVDACVSYGMSAPLYDESGNRALSVRAAARRHANELIKDAQAFEDAMDKPVNAIGSTAREFSHGNLNAAMDRAMGRAPTAQAAQIKLYGSNAPECPPELETRVPSDDPIAYMYGFMTGLRGDSMVPADSSEADLAAAYKEGYARGRRVGNKEEPMPLWYKSAA